MDSEIFDNYVKIALEQGLIAKEAYPNNLEQMKKNELEDSDLSEYEILYGVKPNGKEDDTHILEKAHPDTVVISPAQDRFNGVIENLYERQNIMHDIATRNPGNSNPNKNYVQARNDLMNSIIRVGFDMDNQDQEDLMKLADSCASRLDKKVAWVPVAVGVGSLLAYVYGVYNSRLIDQGVLNSIQNAKKEIEESRDNIPESVSTIDNALQIINYFEKYATRFFNLKSPQIKSVDDLANVAQSNLNELTVYADYKQACANMLEVLPSLITEFESLSSSQKESNWWRILAPFKATYEFIAGNDVKDAANALKTLQVSITNSLKAVHAVEQRAQSKANSSDFIKKFEEARKKMKSSPAAEVKPEQKADDYESQIMNLPIS